MRAPNFLVRIYHFASPSHRRAARERREEYRAHFDEHREENAKRVHRISQLRGDHNTANFLYDSAHGTGAAASRQSLHDTQPAYATSTQRRSGGRPFSTMTDFAEPSPGSASSGYGSTTGSAMSNFSARRSMSVTPTTAPLASHPPARSPPSYEQIAVPMPVTRTRPRPISLPAIMPQRPSSRLPGMIDDWWQPSEITADPGYGEHVQVLSSGSHGDDRELRMTAMVA